MKLYYSQFTRSHRPRWVLEELGVTYELHRLSLRQGEHKAPEHLKVHPLGLVPALEDDGLVLVESAAICQYLADKYPEKALAPAPGTRERGEYYQWMTFVPATLEPPLSIIFENTVLLPEEARQPALVDKARQRVQPALRMLENRVTGREFIVGNRFTVADVMIASALSWATVMEVLVDYPGLQAYMERHMARPAAERAYAD